MQTLSNSSPHTIEGWKSSRKRYLRYIFKMSRECPCLVDIFSILLTTWHRLTVFWNWVKTAFKVCIIQYGISTTRKLNASLFSINIVDMAILEKAIGTHPKYLNCLFQIPSASIVLRCKIRLKVLLLHGKMFSQWWVWKLFWFWWEDY